MTSALFALGRKQTLREHPQGRAQTFKRDRLRALKAKRHRDAATMTVGPGQPLHFIIFAAGENPARSLANDSASDDVMDEVLVGLDPGDTDECCYQVGWYSNLPPIMLGRGRAAA